MLKQFFKSAFKPSLEHKDPDVRIKALELLNQDQLDTFTTLIHEDQEASVRLTAFTKLHSIELLLTHYNTTAHAADKPLFSKHIIDRLDEQYKLQSLKKETVDLLKSQQFFDTFIQQTSNAALLDQIANAYSTDEADQLTLIKNTKQHAIRAKLIKQLATESAMREAFHWLKSRDKTAAKLCKQRLDAIVETKKQTEEQQCKAENILQKLKDSLTKHQKFPLAAILDVQQKAFDAIDQSVITEDVIDAINQSIKAVERTLSKEAQDKAQAAKANEEASQKQDVLSTLNEDFAKVEEAISQMASEEAEAIDKLLAAIKENLTEQLGDTPLEKDTQGKRLLKLEKRVATYQEAYAYLLDSSKNPTHELSMDQAKQRIQELSQFDKAD